MDDGLGSATEHIQRGDRKDKRSHPQHLTYTSLLKLCGRVAFATAHFDK